MSNHKIMVVEDEILVALDVSQTIEESGYAVVGPYASLGEAIDALGDGLPDLALLDVQLGSEDVFPLARVLNDSDVPIVFHSGHAEAHELEAQFPSAVVCSKPCSPQQLRNTLQRLLNR